MTTKIDDVLARVGTLKGRKDPWLQLWQEVAEMFLPERAEFTSSIEQGSRANESIYDATPRLAARGLSSALDGLMKDKASNWFEVIPEDEDLLDDPAVQSWVEAVRERMWRAIYNPHGRFIKASTEADSALVCFGWACLWISENKNRNGLLFKSYHNRDVMLDENADGVIDCIGIEELLTPRKALLRFGEENLAPQIKKDLAQTSRNRVEPLYPFVELVLPREDYDAAKIGPQSMRFKYIAVDVKNEKIMAEGGFHEFPAATPRWDTIPGQVYSRSPAIIALPDSNTLNQISKTLLVGGERAVDPPILLPSDAFITPIRTFPGGISAYDIQALADSGLSQPFFPFPVSTALPVGREMQSDYRYQVSQAFFADVLKLPIEKKEMTATEILERKQEFIRALGPVFGRLETDYIGKIVERVYGIMERAGAFPPKPEQMMEAGLNFRFQSPIQQARKAMEVAGFSRALEVITPLATVDPSLLDNIDGDQIMREAPQWAGMPTDWLRTLEEVEQIRGERAQAEEAAQIAGGAAPVADAIKSVAQAEQIATTPV